MKTRPSKPDSSCIIFKFWESDDSGESDDFVDFGESGYSGDDTKVKRWNVVPVTHRHTD